MTNSDRINDKDVQEERQGSVKSRDNIKKFIFIRVCSSGAHGDTENALGSDK